MVYTYPIPEFTTLRSQTEESMASYKNLLQIGDEVKQLDFEGRMYDTEAEVEVAVDGCGYRVLWDVGDEHLYLIIPKGTEKVRMLVDSSVVEIFFGGGKNAWTDFFSVTTKDSVKLGLIGDGETCTFNTLNMWQVSPFNFDASMVM